MPVKKTTQEEKTNTASRLYRSETNKVIAGVCGGLGDFFNVDPSLIRLIFVLIALFGGGGVLLYIILWLIIPTQSSISEITHDSIKKNADEIKDSAQKFADRMKINTTKANSRTLFGVITLILGVMFLLGNFGLFEFFHFAKLWPLVLVIIGLAFLARGDKK